MTMWMKLGMAGAIGMSVILPSWSQEDAGLNLRELMVSVVAPNTNKIWSASDIKSDSEWLELDQAASTVIAAAQLTALGGADGAYAEQAKNADWQAFTQRLIAAARSAQQAIQNHDEDALFNAGNELLYPPCEDCHTIYLPR